MSLRLRIGGDVAGWLRNSGGIWASISDRDRDKSMFGWDKTKWIAGWERGGIKYSRSEAGAGGVEGPPESKSEDSDSEPSECARDCSDSVGEGRGVGGTGVKGSWGIGTDEVGVKK